MVLGEQKESACFTTVAQKTRETLQGIIKAKILPGTISISDWQDSYIMDKKGKILRRGEGVIWMANMTKYRDIEQEKDPYLNVKVPKQKV